MAPVCLYVVMSVIASVEASAQDTNNAASQTDHSTPTPPTITLDEAIHRAQAIEPTYAIAVADTRSSALDRFIARSAILPHVTYHNQYLYTEGNGSFAQSGQGAAPSAAPRFIANNAVHEYTSQALVDETIGLTQIASVRRADASAAISAASLEISRRGLVATVSGLYYAVLSADRKLAIAGRARTEAADLTTLTSSREQQREAAHADVIKAQLQQQQRERELSDARTAAQKTRLELGVLLFPDPLAPYALIAEEPSALGSFDEFKNAAEKNSPELKSAIAELKRNNAEVLAARGGYLPALELNYTYGIDAPQFAINGPALAGASSKVSNLGYSASVTLDIPIWDWLATQRKLKQSNIRREAAQVTLTAAHRRLIARIHETYSELVAARDQLALLDASVNTAEESRRLTKNRYAGGEATVLEVVDAQAAFVAAENAREDGRVRFEAALIDLQTLTGSR
jgi:outer membrane protein TolC